MNTFQSTTKLFWLALTIGSGFILSSVLGLAPSYSAPQDTTTFDCVRSGNHYATIARRGSRTTSPMITWKDTSIKNWSPQRRCQHVSGKLTRAVASSGGRLRTLRLTHGTVNSQPVICYITHPEQRCNVQNMLLTLKPSERGREKEILDQLMAFGITGTGLELTRTGDTRTIVTFGKKAEEILNGLNSTNKPSSSRTTPVNPSEPRSSSPVDENGGF